MNLVKTKLLLATLLTFTFGTAGCATAQPIGTGSFNSTQVLFNAAQTTTSPAVQFAPASSYQMVQLPSNTLAGGSLTTLSPNDDLLSMIEKASGVVLLDFYADWCGPCRTQGGILHEMESAAMQKNASMIKINVDQHRQLANTLNVTSLPTLILIKDGRIVERQTGVANHQRVAALLSK